MAGPNHPPICDAGGPYAVACQGAVTAVRLDGRKSQDPDAGDVILIDDAGQHNAGASIGTDARFTGSLLSPFCDYVHADLDSADKTHRPFNNPDQPFPGTDWSRGYEGGTSLLRAERSVAVIKGPQAPAWFFLADDFQKDTMSRSYEWLLHTDSTNTVDIASDPFTVQGTRSRMLVWFAHPRLHLRCARTSRAPPRPANARRQRAHVSMGPADRQRAARRGWCVLRPCAGMRSREQTAPSCRIASMTAASAAGTQSRPKEGLVMRRSRLFLALGSMTLLVAHCNGTTTPPPTRIVAVTADPAGATLQLDAGTTQLRATARDASNRIVDNRSFTWSSSNSAVVSVPGAVGGQGNPINVTPNSPGVATITATSEGIYGSAVISVNAPATAATELTGRVTDAVTSAGITAATIFFEVHDSSRSAPNSPSTTRTKGRGRPAATRVLPCRRTCAIGRRSAADPAHRTASDSPWTPPRTRAIRRASLASKPTRPFH